MSRVADVDARIRSEDMTDFARVMRSEIASDQQPVTGTSPRINVSDDDVCVCCTSSWSVRPSGA